MKENKQLPKGWKTKKLGEVCDIVAGGDKPKKNSKFMTDEYFVPIFANGEKNKGLYGYTDIARINKPSITISGRGTIGYSEIRTQPFVPIVRLIVLLPNDKIININFLHYGLKNIDFSNSGSSIPQLTIPMVKEYSILFPSLFEQKQTVVILDRAFKAIDQAKTNTEKNLKNAKELFESYLQNIFENKGDDWEEKKLDDVCIVERGSSPRPIKKYITDCDDGVNWIKIGDTKNIEKYIYKTKQKITKEGTRKSRFVEEGDFILSNSMSFGKPYIIKTKGCIHDGWFKLKLHSFIDTSYFYQLLSSSLINNQFKNLASGSVVQNISGDLVKKVILPIPPIETQQKIVKKLDTLQAQTKKLEAIYQKKINNLIELKKSILQKVFKGELL